MDHKDDAGKYMTGPPYYGRPISDDLSALFREFDLEREVVNMQKHCHIDWPDAKYLVSLAHEFRADLSDVIRLYLEGMPIEELARYIQGMGDQLWRVRVEHEPINPTFVEVRGDLMEVSFYQYVRKLLPPLARVINHIAGWFRWLS